MIAAVIFLLAFFVTSQLTKFHHVRTETVQVVDISRFHGFRTNIQHAHAKVKFETGAIELVSFHPRKSISVGQFIDVDVLEAEGKKPRYRLAQDPVRP